MLNGIVEGAALLNTGPEPSGSPSLGYRYFRQDCRFPLDLWVEKQLEGKDSDGEG